MEDFIKNKLTEYTPPFQEAYWTEMSAMLQKKRRRKRLLLLLFSGSSALVGIILVWAFVFMNSSERPEGKDAEIELKQSKSNNISKDDMAKDDVAQALDETNISSKLVDVEVVKNKMKIAAASKPTLQNKQNETHSINKIDVQKEDTENAIADRTVHTFSKNSSPAYNGNLKTSQSPIAGADVIKSTNQTKFDTPDFDSHSTTTVPNQSGSINAPDEAKDAVLFSNTRPEKMIGNQVGAISRLAYPKISMFDRHIILPFVTESQHVEISITTNPIFPQMKTAFEVGAGIVSNTSNNLISYQTLQLKRYVHFNQSIVYTAFGLAASRYHGLFQALDHEDISFRTFTENTIEQSLTPRAIYDLSIPIEIGIVINRVNLAVVLRPAYLLGAYGDIINTEKINTIVSGSNAAGEPAEFSVAQNVVEQKVADWLDTQNVNSTNFSFGVSAGYRMGKRLHLSLAAEYFPKGLYSFKRTVRLSNSLTGRKNNIKGGLHVAYIF